MGKKYYDPKYKRLVFFSDKASAEYWDKQWVVEIEKFKKRVTSVPNSSFVKKITDTYLQGRGKILEGGCGNGQFVYALKKWGYDPYGVDYAPKTVLNINTHFPELKITKGDVRNLPFKDDFFQGYWSFGVIEHFYDGYGDILREMHRVIGGVVFYL